MGPVVRVLPSKGAEVDTEEQNAQIEKNEKQGKKMHHCKKLVKWMCLSESDNSVTRKKKSTNSR